MSGAEIQCQKCHVSIPLFHELRCAHCGVCLCRNCRRIDGGTLLTVCIDCQNRSPPKVSISQVAPSQYPSSISPIAPAVRASCGHNNACYTCDRCGKSICPWCSVTVGTQHVCLRVCIGKPAVITCHCCGKTTSAVATCRDCQQDTCTKCLRGMRCLTCDKANHVVDLQGTSPADADVKTEEGVAPRLKKRASVSSDSTISCTDGSVIKVDQSPEALRKFNVNIKDLILIPLANGDAEAEVVGVDRYRLIVFQGNDFHCSAVQQHLLPFIVGIDFFYCRLCGRSYDLGIENQHCEDHGVESCREIIESPPLATTVSQETTTSVENSYKIVSDDELIGQGAQGQVWKCTAIDALGDKVCVVAKKMFFPEKDRKNFEACKDRTIAVKNLQHDHLIKYLDVVCTEKPLSISIIMPFYHESHLRDLVVRKRSQKTPIDQFLLCSISLQLAQALQYLHSRGVVHRDVKSENVLMFDNYTRTLLMDLDTAKQLGPNNSPAATVIGTAEYMAPEIFRMQGSTKSDVWSLGVLLLELASLPDVLLLPLGQDQVTLYCEQWTTDTLEKAIRQAIYANTRQYAEMLVSLIVKMLSHDPQQRPTASDVCQALAEIMEAHLCGDLV